MCKIINYIKDPEYFKVFCAYGKIQKELEDGIELKDIDVKLFYLPNDFSSQIKVMMAQMYIDYIAEKNNIKKQRNLIKEF